MSREIGLVELIENILGKHQPDSEGYCDCGFCVYGFLHQAAMLAPEIERLLAQEREKVREMCIHGIETILLRPEDSEQLVERIELGIKIRQFDLTAPSTDEGKGGDAK